MKRGVWPEVFTLLSIWQSVLLRRVYLDMETELRDVTVNATFGIFSGLLVIGFIKSGWGGLDSCYS